MTWSPGGSLCVRGGEVVSESGVVRADVRIVDGVVDAVGPGLPVVAGMGEIDARGKLVFPGLIDPQVHFREPGLTHKEDLASGSLAAIAGGVTAFLEMPNTKPATTTPALLQDKLDRASGRCFADYGFFLGATAENADLLGEWEGLPGVCGIKVFMGSSTGDLLIADDKNLERVLRSGRKRVAVHAEDEPRLQERLRALPPGATVALHHEVRDVECAVRATTRLLTLAEKTHRKVHVLHVSTAEEVAILRDRQLTGLVTAEVTPNHLFLAAPDCYREHGALAQMNPPVRERRHRDALRQALAEGVLTCIGSDHAPHTREEKALPYPRSPSGIPGVQTILPLLLTAVRDGWLRRTDLARICCSGPAAVWDIDRKGRLAPGMDGDLVVVDSLRNEPLRLEELHSGAGWSPYVGWQVAGRPVVTVLRGQIAYQDGAWTPRGRMLHFGG